MSGAVGRGKGWRIVSAERTTAKSIMALKLGEKNHFWFSIKNSHFF